jgi:hypothetical protein
MQPSQEIYRDEYVSLYIEYGGKLARWVRTSLPFPSIAALELSYDHVYSALKQRHLKECRLLSDVRAAPGRNEPEFEAAMERIRNRIYPLFIKHAILVQSSVGKLHMSRLIKQDNYPRLVSQSEAEILAYLGLA